MNTTVLGLGERAGNAALETVALGLERCLGVETGVRFTALPALCEQVAVRDGAIVSVQGFARGESNLLLERLYIERSLSVNTAAAGGNTSLMTLAV